MYLVLQDLPLRDDIVDRLDWGLEFLHRRGEGQVEWAIPGPGHLHTVDSLNARSNRQALHRIAGRNRSQRIRPRTVLYITAPLVLSQDGPGCWIKPSPPPFGANDP